MKRINLLPPEQRTRASRERGLLYVIVFLVAVVLALGLVYLQQSNTLSGKQDDLAALQAETAAVQAQKDALAPYAAIEQTRTSMTETAKTIYVSRVPWSTVLEQVSLVIPENVRLTNLNCAVPAAMLPGAQPGTEAAAASTDVTLNGTTYTPDDIAEFMTRLGLIPQLQNIRLTTSTRTSASSSSTSGTGTSTAPAEYRWQFTITASLRPHLTPPPTTTLTEAAQ